MAGLADLNRQEIIENDKTSSVPVNKSDLEPYEPSAARGVAGLALAGAGAVALRNPIGRAIQKIAGIKLPKAPVSRTTGPVDEVDEILSVVPTKMDRGRAMTAPQISQQEQIRQIAIARSNELKKLSYNAPLSRGGKTKRIGSSLYDYIARHPIAGARKPEEWIKDFKSGGPGSFKTGNPEFKNISQAVKREEMWDANIAQFDKAGNLVGGFLKVAQEKKIPLTKMDLLYIVEKAPVNNLKMRKLGTDVKIVDEAEDLGRDINNSLDGIRNKVIAKVGDSQEAEDIVEIVNTLQKDVRKQNALMYNKYKEVQEEYRDFDSSPFGKIIGDYEVLIPKARRLGIEVDPLEISRITEAGKAKDIDIFRRLQLQKSQGFETKYGNYSEYRIKGGDEYFENVVYYPKELPMGQKLSGGFNRHYQSGDKAIPNQVYHVRGSIRSGGNENQKVMMIDEIQSDYHQKLRKINPARDKVQNAFGSEIEFFSANRKLEKIVDEMKTISAKGIKATREDQARFNKLNSEFREMRSNSLNLSNITNREAQDGIPFLPLYGKENWGAHALKNQIKDAADRGVDWVAISPVEYLHHAKRTKYLGDIEFYGTRTGKAGFKGYGGRQGVVRKDANDNEVPIQGFTDPKKKATLPAAMDKIAREYGSEVKTIPVAKSDPNKPFKVVQQVDTKKEFGLNPDKSRTQHKAAFKTEQEAQYYAGRYNGEVEKIMEGDPRLYFDAYAIRVNKEMVDKPFKAYNTGGLVVNIFA